MTLTPPGVTGARPGPLHASQCPSPATPHTVTLIVAGPLPHETRIRARERYDTVRLALDILSRYDGGPDGRIVWARVSGDRAVGRDRAAGGHVCWEWTP